MHFLTFNNIKNVGIFEGVSHAKLIKFSYTEN